MDRCQHGRSGANHKTKRHGGQASIPAVSHSGKATMFSVERRAIRELFPNIFGKFSQRRSPTKPNKSIKPMEPSVSSRHARRIRTWAAKKAAHKDNNHELPPLPVASQALRADVHAGADSGPGRDRKSVG